MDFTQWITFCMWKCSLASIAMSRGIQGSEGLPPTLRNMDPSSRNTRLHSAITAPIQARNSRRGRLSL